MKWEPPEVENNFINKIVFTMAICLQSIRTAHMTLLASNRASQDWHLRLTATRLYRISLTFSHLNHNTTLCISCVTFTNQSLYRSYRRKIKKTYFEYLQTASVWDERGNKKKKWVQTEKSTASGQVSHNSQLWMSHTSEVCRLSCRFFRAIVSKWSICSFLTH